MSDTIKISDTDYTALLARQTQEIAELRAKVQHYVDAAMERNDALEGPMGALEAENERRQERIDRLRALLEETQASEIRLMERVNGLDRECERLSGALKRAIALLANASAGCFRGHPHEKNAACDGVRGVYDHIYRPLAPQPAEPCHTCGMLPPAHTGGCTAAPAGAPLAQVRGDEHKFGRGARAQPAEPAIHLVRNRLAEAFIRGMEVGAERPDDTSDGNAMYQRFRDWADAAEPAGDGDKEPMFVEPGDEPAGGEAKAVADPCTFCGVDAGTPHLSFCVARPAEAGPTKRPTLTQAIQQLVNSYSRENESDTPDFILSQYLINEATR